MSKYVFEADLTENMTSNNNMSDTISLVSHTEQVATGSPEAEAPIKCHESSRCNRYGIE